RTTGWNTKVMCMDHPRRSVMGNNYGVPRQRFQETSHTVIDMPQAFAAGPHEIPVVVLRVWYAMAHNFFARHPGVIAEIDLHQPPVRDVAGGRQTTRLAHQLHRVAGPV